MSMLSPSSPSSPPSVLPRSADSFLLTATASSSCLSTSLRSFLLTGPVPGEAVPASFDPSDHFWMMASWSAVSTSPRACFLRRKISVASSLLVVIFPPSHAMIFLGAANASTGSGSGSW
eukprot:CAMPEP_0205923546 /NCGR_PEP_ID=MMETSP1325-20131115/16402_1 /ASSEMBLY_ACC=CAM_ASM_000708 /TAXON_ID=236786 /ORGANISM="Florenciella sp., Strain RCC1007" /LENGTH=118 /DNA_ID=CAMNT_0053291781 /DNA_START=62 /DNA_END=415 /DNA_ORIENTATION=-